MTRRTARFLVLVLALACWPGLATAAPEVTLRDDNALWDKPIALDLKDAEVRQVLTLVFQIAEEQVLIDPCVQGKVSLKFENVSLRDALSSIARMGEFQVRPRSEGYYVGCAEPAAGGESLDEDAPRIEFRLTKSGDPEPITEPTLIVEYDRLAEIKVGSLPADDLDDVGDFFEGERRPLLRVKIYLHRDEDEIAPDRLRGVMELAARDTTTPHPALRMAARSFELPFPVGSVDVPIARLEVAGETYELTASRPTR